MIPLWYRCICGYVIYADNFQELEAKMRHYDKQGYVCWIRKV